MHCRQLWTDSAAQLGNYLFLRVLTGLVGLGLGQLSCHLFCRWSKWMTLLSLIVGC